MDFIKKVLRATETKRQQKTEIVEEYKELEQVPPAPGNAWGQHDAMVSLGLCEAGKFWKLLKISKDISMRNFSFSKKQ